MGDIDVEKLKQTCGQIVREGDLDSLTDRVVRRSAEEKLGLESKVLDEAPYKQLVKDTVAETLATLTKEQENEEGGDGTAAESENDQDGSDEDDANGKEDEEGSADEDEADGKDNADESEDKVDDEDDFSDVVDEEPPAKPSSRSKKRESADTSPQKAKRAKTAAANKTATGSETTIANLKSYINKCGVRKVWAKELAGMNGAQQIHHLKKTLDDLGMTGRPTLEKCKKIKAKRDLQAELEEMNTGNIIDEDRAPAAGATRSRRGAARNVSYNVDHVSDSEEEEEESDGGNESGDERESGSGNESGSEGGQEEQGEESDEESEESDAYTEGESENDEDGDKNMAAESSEDEDEAGAA